MALVNRISRIFTADLHAVLDRIEEPQVLLAQSIREMADAVAADERRLAAVQERRQQYQRDVAASNARLAEFDRELDLCLGSDQDDLARSVIRKKLAESRAAASLTCSAREADEATAELTAVLEERRRDLEEIRQQAEVVRRDRPVPRVDYDAVSDSDVEIALLAEKERRSTP
ncbi:MAG: PspA/IM30 family protein [Gammaproteobacteria bacterium]|nr:PspA/IM30 family protein [Gammaproteobacteria bacterium]